MIEDYFRFGGFAVFVLVFFAWAVIMGRSIYAYVDARRRGVKADLRLHIWLITLSFLLLLAGTMWDIFQNLGAPLEPDDAPVMLVAGPLALVALWLFVRDRRTTIRIRNKRGSGP